MEKLSIASHTDCLASFSNNVLFFTSYLTALLKSIQLHYQYNNNSNKKSSVGNPTTYDSSLTPAYARFSES